jgi:hypothetical protein
MNLANKLQQMGFGIIDVYNVAVILKKNNQTLHYTKAKGIEKIEGSWTDEEMKLVKELEEKKGDVWSE